MNLRPLAALGVLLATVSLAQGAPPKSWKPPAKAGAAARKPAAPAPAAPAKKPVHYVNGIPDTGQFLPDTAVLGRIDEHVFRVKEFRERWFASYMLDRPKGDSAGKLEFLNSMVNKEVLADLARQVNRPLGFEDRQRIREARQRMLSNAVFARLVADSVRVTPGDVQHLYEQSGWQLHLQQIVSDHPAPVEAARAAVLSGRMTWADAVKKYSAKTGDTGPDGDIGWRRRMDFGPAPALEIFDLKDGGVSSIFRDEPGWRFVRVIGRKPQSRPAFNVVERGLRDEMRDVLLGRRTEEVRARIRQRIGMVYDTTNVAWASDMFRATERQSPSHDEKGRPVLDMSGTLPDFQVADTARVLARWNGGSFTLGGFLDSYNAIPPPQRDRVGSFGAFRSNLDRFVLEPYVAQLGEERGLDKDPIVLDQVARTEEQVRVEHLYSDSIESRISITPRERRDFYQEHLPNYVTWQSVRFAAITRPGKGAADSLAARLKAGESAAAILRADSVAGQVTGSIQDMREDERGQHYYKLLFEEMRPGSVEVVGPDKQGVYLVLQKLAHAPGRQMSYEEVQGWVDEALQNLHAERALKALIERHRAGHVIELRPERMNYFTLVESRD